MSVLLLGMLVAVPSALAQQSAPDAVRLPDSSRTLRGVVWQPPPDLEQAEDELRRMKAAGVEAVRTEMLAEERLLAAADTLGLQFFQELPVAYLPAPALREALGAMRQRLAAALQRAQGHPSARHFGLLRYGDTSDPAACAYVEALAAQVRQSGPPGSQAYYLTAFAETDRCAGAADFVLVSALDQGDPAAALARWAAAQRVPVGIAATGTWVEPDAARGLRVPHSPEAQARYLETHLPPLLRGARAGTEAAPQPVAVFVYQWRDRDPERHRRRYGLFGAEGPRPALAVVRGVFTERQSVFAFPLGERPRPPMPWLVLFGWGVAGALGTFYASAPLLRRMAARYFQAPGFYRDAVRDGRGALTGAGIGMLVLVSLSTGVLVAAALGTLQATTPFALLLGQLDAPVQTRVLDLLARPWLLVLLAGALHAAAFCLWGLALTAASNRYLPLRSDQVLMLAMGPWWPVLPLMVAALVAATLRPEWAALGAMLVLTGGLLTALVATARALYDYAALTRTPGPLAGALVLISPAFVCLLAMLFAWLQYQVEAEFLWHVLWRP